MGAGVGACCVSGCVTIPCLFVPFVGSIAGNCISGTIIGATETVVGDAVSQKRSAMLWPSVTAIAISIVGGAVNLGLSFALLGSGALVPDLNQPFAPTPFLLASSAVSLVTVTAAIIAPAIVYHLLGVDKEPDDQGGLGFPGIFSPADPTGGRAKREGAVPPAATPTSSTSTSPPPPAAY